MFVPFRTTRTVIQRLLAQNTAVPPIDVEGRTSDVYAKLDKIINGQDGVVDGTTLQNFWFPTQAAEYDVFISHSHNDLGYAVNLASWLERRCELRCFIDHFVWNSADNLLKRIDEIYTWEPNRKVFKDNLKDVIDVFKSADTFVELVPKGIDKGSSLSILGSLLNIHPDQMIAFGDESNDISMLKYVGMGVAVVNATEPAKAAADLITMSNNEDGVAHVIDMML